VRRWFPCSQLDLGSFEIGVKKDFFLAGSKFGGYGSFLPTHQRSPPAPQARSPPTKAANVTSRSPFHQPVEVLGS
jgi:hypothetical protein